jgi:class 3 adenylate cyclase
MNQLDDKPAYVEERTDDGFLNGFRRTSDGVLISLNPEYREYKEFLDWNSTQLNPLDVTPFVVPKTSFYFADREQLIAHCKRFGIMLFDTGCTWSPGELAVAKTAMMRDNKIACLLYKAVPAIKISRSFHSGITSEFSNIWIDQELHAAIKAELPDEDSPIRRLSSWPIRRTFVYIDVSDFSKFPSGQQALVINSIVRVVDDELSWGGQMGSECQKGIEAKICIGDGYIFVFKEPVVAACFAGWLAFIIERHLALGHDILPVEFHFRMGVHVGDVFCFWDPGRDRWNYIGDGINGGQRVLAAAGKEKDDVVYVSDKVRRAIEAARSDGPPSPELSSNLHNRGRHADKHNNYWRIYEMSHTDLIAPWCRV